MNVIEIQNVSKSYGNYFSLKDCSLSIEEGKIFALLGPNGAGKTTLVKLMLNLLHADHGDIKIKGINSSESSSRLGVAFIPEKFNFFPYYTARGVLSFFGKMKGLNPEVANEQIDFALKRLNIEELANRKLALMSKGQIQRVGLASILLGQNDIIVLDEPFSGLDPIGMKDLKSLLVELKGQGKTIFINSHILSEMEILCDEFAILHKGELRYQGTVASVKEKGQTLEDFFYHLVQGERA